jgi:hypothetical protein
MRIACAIDGVAVTTIAGLKSIAAASASLLQIIMCCSPYLGTLWRDPYRCLFIFVISDHDIRQVTFRILRDLRSQFMDRDASDDHRTLSRNPGTLAHSERRGASDDFGQNDEPSKRCVGLKLDPTLQMK